MEKLLVVLCSYGKLSSRLRAHLRVILKRHVYKKGDIIIKEGKICKRIWFIEKGLVRIYTRGKIEVTDWIQYEDHIFIVVDSFFNQTPSTHFIEAQEETIVWSISYEELQDTIERFPQFAIHERKIKSDYYSIFHARESLLKHMKPLEKYKWFMQTEPDLLNRVEAKVIYTYLKISRNKYYAIRSQLAGKKKKSH